MARQMQMRFVKVFWGNLSLKECSVQGKLFTGAISVLVRRTWFDIFLNATSKHELVPFLMTFYPYRVTSTQLRYAAKESASSRRINKV